VKNVQLDILDSLNVMNVYAMLKDQLMILVMTLLASAHADQM